MTDSDINHIDNSSSSNDTKQTTNLSSISVKQQHRKSRIRWVLKADEHNDDQKLLLNGHENCQDDFEDSDDDEEQDSDRDSVLSSPKPSSFSSVPSLGMISSWRPESVANSFLTRLRAGTFAR